MAESSDKDFGPSSEPRIPTRAMAIKIAVFYALLGCLWIVGSGWILHHFVHESAMEAWMETLKGWFYVAATALLLGLALDRYFSMIRHSTQLLQANEERFRALFDCNPDGLLVVDLNGHRILFGNGTLCQMLGRSPEELARLSVADIHPKESMARIAEEFAQLARAEKHYAHDIPVLCKDGRIFLADVSSSIFVIDGRRCAVGQFRDITERKQAEQRIREIDTRYRALFDQAADGIAVALVDGNQISVNTAFAKMHGYESPQEMEPLRWQDLDVSGNVEQALERKRRLLAGEGLTFEVEHKRKDGSIFPLSVSGNIIDLSGAKWFIGFHRDISERKRAEKFESLSAEVLRILNDSQALPESTKRILDAIRRETGIDAAGIRLLQENDYPYAVSDGFSREFLQAENSLAERTPEGNFCLDENGNLHLECTCGLVLSGKADADNPLFTPGGSAWMNDATSLLNLPSEQDPRLHPRNRCIHEGFQSIALIPIRVEREIVGLLQLNDRRKNCFTLEMIRYLEGLAASFGVALLRLKEEQAVRASEERFAGIFYNSPAAIGISRLSDGVFLDVNEAFTRLYGYTREELVGHTSADLSLWYSPGRAQLISELQQKNSLQNVGIQVRRKDGEVRDLLASLQLVDLAGDQCILGIMADVTERKRAEAALEESEARYRLVSENSSDVIWLFNTEANRFSFVSPSVERLRGFTVEEVMRQTFEEVLTPESHRIVMDGMPRRLAAFAAGEESAQSMTQEVLQVCKDGTSVPTEVVTTLIADAQGRVTHIQGVARDITVRKRLEAQVRQGQKLEAIGQLAGGIAHDFNNILAATMMRVDLMRMKKGLNPEILQGLKDLESEMRRAADLTKQLLMFGRQSVLAVKPLDLNDVTVNIMRMLSRLIGEHIDLRFEGKAALPCVKADAGMLEQVIINLAVNARDAMPNGGRITIGTSVATLSEEQVRGSNERRPGEFLCLTVSDTGCGMDAETLKRIFDPFFTTKEQGKGTGLGLATVDGIVAQHKGWVEVESTVGQGTTFRVFLPAIAGKAEEIEAQSRETEPAPGGKESLLVVEDDRALRMLIVQLLRSWGYRVFEASTGQEALTLWQSQSSNIDLILTDMVMPEGMTGLELVESLRSRKPGLKAIISSGYSSDIVQAGLPTKAGIVFLPKPYEAKLLAKVVRECLDPKS